MGNHHLARPARAARAAADRARGSQNLKPLGDRAVSEGSLVPRRRILLLGGEPGKGARIYVRDLGDTGPRAISPEGCYFDGRPVSPDGQWVAAVDPDEKPVLYPVAGGEPRPLAGLTGGDHPIRWSADGRSLYPGLSFRCAERTGHRQASTLFTNPAATGFCSI